MKKRYSFPWPASLTGMLGCILLASFSFLPGGDSYTISINGEQIIQHYVFSKNPVPNLPLNVKSNDTISVYYSECGKIGTARMLSLRDEKGSVLREWKFKDALSEHTAMHLRANELEAKGKSLFLFYSSKEVTKAQQLAKLVANATGVTK